MSAAALCQMDVAAHYAADPVAASKLAARASFDCAKAQTPLEKAICSDISLGYADIVLSRVYSGLLKNPDQTDKATFVPSERQWLQKVPAKCGLLAPPFSAKSLTCTRNEFEFRFTALDSCQESITDSCEMWTLRQPRHRSRVPAQLRLRCAAERFGNCNLLRCRAWTAGHSVGASLSRREKDHG